MFTFKAHIPLNFNSTHLSFFYIFVKCRYFSATVLAQLLSDTKDVAAAGIYFPLDLDKTAIVIGIAIWQH
jgi:hypothetical protein